MRVLTLNCGSSSLKFDVFEVAAAAPDGAPERVARGSVAPIGDGATSTLDVAGAQWTRRSPVRDHAHAVTSALALLGEADILAGIEAVGHRVVHGGTRFREPARVDDSVIGAIEAASALAPLHNGPALAALRAARSALGGAAPMVACFDTAYYARLPEVAAVYAIPAELADRLGVRRFGFHGFAHRDMAEAFQVLHPDVARPRLVTLQLGNGCSATASVDGRPLDTSMGFTPLEGLIMGTRSGDLDPAIPLAIAERAHLTPEEVEALLNRHSGLLGISGLSGDMHVLLDAAAAGHRGARLAIEAFCYRAAKYIGAYLTVLGGANGIVFGGGIGERSPEIRARICARLDWAGVQVDPAANEAATGDGTARATRISAAESAVSVWVVGVDEASLIARDTAACVHASTRG